MTRKRKTEARKKRKINELNAQEPLSKKKLQNSKGGEASQGLSNSEVRLLSRKQKS